MRHVTLLLATFAAAVGMACAASTPHQAATVPQSRVADSLKTIALDPVCPCGLPADLRAIDPHRGKFDSLLTAELSNAGFGVVPAAESQAIWDRLTDSLGGLFDPVSGQVDTTTYRKVRTLTLRELQQRFHVDAWLHPIIVLAPADFRRGTAKWDGTKQAFGRKLFGITLGTTYGTTPALSLHVIVEGMDGKVLFDTQAGLQLYQVPSGNGFVRIPDAQLYTDQERNAAAVRLALAPLLAHTALQRRSSDQQ